MDTHHQTIAAGSRFPALDWPLVGGGRLDLSTEDGWRLLVVYRGKHCPICRKYLATLDGLATDFEAAGIRLAVVSADPREKAEAQVAEGGLKLRVAYDMTREQMRRLGLYVSEPRSPQETDRPFAEPAVFAINPDGRVQVVDVSNAPFSRPDLASLLSGLKFIREKDYPVRGTLD